MTFAHRCSSHVTGHRTPGHRRLRSTRRAALCAGLLMAVTAVPAQAGMAAQLDSYSTDPVRLTDAELRSLRGGMNINGVDFDFGAVVRVFVDGPLVAETALSLNMDGSINRATTIHNAGLAAEFNDPSQLNGGNIQFGSLDGTVGFVISGANGLSLALNNIKPGDIAGILANNAAGRNIVQTIDVNLTINNFTQINTSLQSSIAMGRAMSAAAPNPMLMH